MNCYIKLLVLPTTPVTLLYGFCVPTKKNVHDWKMEKIKNIPILKCTCILNEMGKYPFFEAICKGTDISIANQTLNLRLQARHKVYYCPSCDTTAAPTKQFHILYEYWQTDKKHITEKINESLKDDRIGEQIKQLQTVISVIKNEAGLDLLKEGDRLGNFERYEPTPYTDLFDIKNTGQTLVIRKKKNIDELLTVSCETVLQGRVTNNVIKEFEVEADELTFETNDVISDCTVKVWNTDGNLVFSSELGFVLHFGLQMQLSGGERSIVSGWTQKLRRSSSNCSDRIDKVEKIQTVSSTQRINMPSTLPAWCKAFWDGRSVMATYNVGDAKGAFVPKISDKSGEIDSFEKVRELIDCDSVERVILADPFFSVRSIDKLLPRISFAELKLEILTSLADINPDTEENGNYIEQCRAFISANQNLFHSNTRIVNIRSGKKQAFHDRYLIRYLKSGGIDGFVLSNSLNSAGQFYPFVIAPLEKEICYCVAEYLQNLCVDSSYQSEILYETPKKARQTPREACVFPCYISNIANGSEAIDYVIKKGYITPGSTPQSYHTNKQFVRDIVADVFSRWDANPFGALCALGDALCHSYIEELNFSEEIEKLPEAIAKYKKAVLEFAPMMEKEQHHDKKDIGGSEYQYYGIMNGNIVPSRVSHWRRERVYYDTSIGYWRCIYELLFKIDCSAFMTLLETAKSPLMLSLLIENISFQKFNDKVYSSMLQSEWYWMRELAAEWLLNCHETISVSQAIKNQKNEATQLEQYVYILSELSFQIRNQHRNSDLLQSKKTLYFEVKEAIKDLCNKGDLEKDLIVEKISKLYECDSTAYATLRFSVAETIDNKSVRDFLLDSIIDDYRRKFEDSSIIPFDIGRNSTYIQKVLEAITLRYDEDIDKQIQKLLHWSHMNDYVEPYLDQYNYERWSKAMTATSWDLALLNEYRKNNALTGKLEYFYQMVAQPM